MQGSGDGHAANFLALRTLWDPHSAGWSNSQPWLLWGIAANSPRIMRGDPEASMRWALASVCCALGGAAIYARLPAMKIGRDEGKLVQVVASTVGCRRADLQERRRRYVREDPAALSDFTAGTMMGRQCAWISAGEFVHLEERTGSDMRIRHRGVSYWVPAHR